MKTEFDIQQDKLAESLRELEIERGGRGSIVSSEFILNTINKPLPKRECDHLFIRKAAKMASDEMVKSYRPTKTFVLHPTGWRRFTWWLFRIKPLTGELHHYNGLTIKKGK